jgi:hypothetical protein
MRTRIRRLAALGVAVTALSLGAASPAAAEPRPGPSASEGRTGERAAKLCARLPELAARADRLLARFQGGADQPGSVEFIKKRAERARANGHTDLATALDSRAKVRADLIPVLRTKKEGVSKMIGWCAEHGHRVGS